MKLRKQTALLAAFIIVSVGLWGCGGGGGGGGGTSVAKGGVKGSINVTVSGAGAQAGPGATRSILSAPVTIRSSRGEAVRKSYYGHKGLPVTTCRGNEFVPGELIVKLKSSKSRESFAKAEGLKVKSDVGPKMFLTGVNTGGLKGESALDRTRQACIEMNERPDVEFADLNHIMKKMSVNPNDANFGLQWHYNLINLPQAWEITTGSNSVIVAVVDTGIVPGHADLAGRLISGYDFITDIPTACDGNGRDADPEDRADSTCASGPIPTYSPEHSGYHGTHVAGTIGAATNNGIGVAGVTWSTKIMPVRVLGAGGGYDSDIIAGMYYAGKISGHSPQPAVAANIINMSIGGEPELGCAYGYATVFSDLHDAGVLVFVAAGNEQSADAINPLAQCEYAMAVAAVNRSAEKAWYSNAGPGVDIAAPGGDTTYTGSDGIYSTVRDDNGNIDSSYAYMQGTSMATPHAAGVAALIMAAGLAASPSRNLTVDQVADIMTDTATALPNDTNHYKYGAGLINAYDAALEAQGGTPSGDPEIAVSTTYLYFSQYDTAKTVIITNTGGGDLTISSVTTDVVTGDWLDGSYQAGTGKFTLTITVDRTGLAGGRYDGTVTIASNGGADVVIQIAMQVNTPEPGAPPACGFPGADSNIYIIALDADNKTVGQTDITVSGGEYMMIEVPQSSSGYYIRAGTDCDINGYICETGDYCGIYPLEDSPVLVKVDGQVFSEGVDFSVREVSGGTALSKMIGARGFKLLHR